MITTCETCRQKYFYECPLGSFYCPSCVAGYTPAFDPMDQQTRNRSVLYVKRYILTADFCKECPSYSRCLTIGV